MPPTPPLTTDGGASVRLLADVCSRVVSCLQELSAAEKGAGLLKQQVEELRSANRCPGDGMHHCVAGGTRLQSACTLACFLGPVSECRYGRALAGVKIRQTTTACNVVLLLGRAGCWRPDWMT